MGISQIQNLIILNFNLRQHISEMLGHGHVYHSKHSTSGNRGDELVDFFGREMLSHSCAIEDSSCSTVPHLFVEMFLFHDA